MRNRTPLAALTAACLTLAALAAASSPAAAGVYTVHSCKTPSGENASTSDWVLTRATVATAQVTSACPAGPLTMALAPNTSHGPMHMARINFTAPADTDIRGYTIYRSLRLGSRYNYWHSDTGIGLGEVCYTTKASCSALGDPAQPFAARNLLQASDRSGMRGIEFKLTCGESDTGTTSCPALALAGVFQLHRADITLNDTYTPRFEAAPTGPLVDSGAVLTGVQPVWITGSDRGSGVYRAQLEVDGRVAASSVLDANGGRCQEPFTVAKPCAALAAGGLSLNTAQLSDGVHTLRILLTDATGTNVTQWGPVAITTANGSCNPSPRIDAMKLSAAFATGSGASRRTITSTYERELRVEGQLASALGVAAPGARVCILTREQRTDAPLRELGATVTDRDGRFSFALPGGPSREVLVVHRVSGGAAVTALAVRVKAALSLRASKKRVANGGRVTLAGKLLREPMPSRGVIIELQARRGSRWQTFGTTRTRPDGRYALKYRFTRTTGAHRYAMRAVVAQQATYPFARGASKPIRVRVGRR